jgi:hypothetical protein
MEQQQAAVGRDLVWQGEGGRRGEVRLACARGCGWRVGIRSGEEEEGVLIALRALVEAN